MEKEEEEVGKQGEEEEGSSRPTPKRERGTA